MANVQFLRPTDVLADEYRAMRGEWVAAGEEMYPWVLEWDPADFAGMVRRLEDAARGIGLPEGFVPHTTFWLVNEGRVVGVVNLRPKLNEFLRRVGGHIGFGVRPGERGKGYGTEMLRRALLETDRLGVAKVLMTCDRKNVASARCIVKNGGVLESEVSEGSVVLQRYWIDRTPQEHNT